MENIFTLSTLYFCIFGMFLSFQQSHARNFEGASQTFGTILNLFVILGTIASLVYIGLLWWNTNWYTALIVFVIGILSSAIVGVSLARMFGGFALSLLGFIGIPLFGTLMFLTIPSS